jgi:hypothetical protein
MSATVVTSLALDSSFGHRDDIAPGGGEGVGEPLVLLDDRAETRT